MGRHRAHGASRAVAMMRDTAPGHAALVAVPEDEHRGDHGPHSTEEVVDTGQEVHVRKEISYEQVGGQAGNDQNGIAWTASRTSGQRFPAQAADVTRIQPHMSLGGVTVSTTTAAASNRSGTAGVTGRTSRSTTADTMAPVTSAQSCRTLTPRSAVEPAEALLIAVVSIPVK